MKGKGVAPIIIILIIVVLGTVVYSIHKTNQQVPTISQNTSTPPDIKSMLVKYFGDNDFSSSNATAQADTYWQSNDKLYLFPNVNFPTTGYDQYSQIIKNLGASSVKSQLQSLLILQGFTKNNENSIPIKIDNTTLVESFAYEKGKLKCVLDYLTPESDDKQQGAVWLSCGELGSDVTSAKFTDTKNISRNPNYELIIDKKNDRYLVYDLISFDGNRYLASKNTSGNWVTVLSFGQTVPLCSEVDKLNLPYDWQPDCSGGLNSQRPGGLILK